MCYLKKRIKNPKYLPNKKNGWNPPRCEDERKRYIDIECGECPECRKKRRREWSIRINEELKACRSAVFFTGTISPSRMEHLIYKYGTTDKNEIITKEARLFFERIRRKHKISVRHWGVTEIGEKNGRVHIHLICFSQTLDKWKLTNILWDNWIAGYKYYGKYCNSKTANYITKYMLKEVESDKDFKGKILTSKGIGVNYCKNKINIQRHAYVKRTENTRTIETYLTESWKEIQLPRYYKLKLWDEATREQLYTEKLDDGIKWIGGNPYPIKTEEQEEYANEVEREYESEISMKWNFSRETLKNIREKRKRKRKSKYIHLIRSGKIKDKVEEYEKRNMLHS